MFLANNELKTLGSFSVSAESFPIFLYKHKYKYHTDLMMVKRWYMSGKYTIMGTYKISYVSDLADLQTQINKAKSIISQLDSKLNKSIPVGGIDVKATNAEARLINARTNASKLALIEQEKVNKSFSTGTRIVQNYGTTAMSTMRSIAGIIGTVGVVKLGKDFISSATKADNLNLMLKNVEGSQAGANKRFEEFRILAKEPVLDPFNLSRFYVGLRSINVEGNLSIKFMKSLANVMAGAGQGNMEFTRTMEQIVQMMGKSKLEGQDLRTILESFPSFAKYLKQAVGTISTEDIAKKGYTAIDVMTKLNAVMEKVPHFSGGAQAAQDNFTQSLQLFEAAMAKDILPTVTEFLTKLTDIMDKFSELQEGTKKIIGTATIGGLGFLAVGAAVTSVVNALDALGMSKGLKVLSSGALSKSLSSPASSGLVWETGSGYTSGKDYQRQMARENPDKYTGIGGSGLMAGLATTAAVASVAWAAQKIYISATSVEVVSKGSTEWAKSQLSDDKKALREFLETQLTVVGSGISLKSKLSDVNPQTIGGMPYYKSLVENAGFNLQSQSTLNSILQAIAPESYGKLKRGQYDTPAGPPEAPKSTLLSWETLTDEYKKISDITSKNYNMPESEQLNYWQNKLRLPLTEEAKMGVINTIKDLQNEVNKQLKEKSAESEKLWFEHAEAIAKETIYEYNPKMMPIIPATSGTKVNRTDARMFPSKTGIPTDVLDRSFLHPDKFTTDTGWGVSLETAKKVADATVNVDQVAADKIKLQLAEIANLRMDNKKSEAYTTGGTKSVLEYEIQSYQDQIDLLRTMEDSKTNQLEIEKDDLLLQQKKSELISYQAEKQKDIYMQVLKTAGSLAVSGISGKSTTSSTISDISGLGATISTILGQPELAGIIEVAGQVASALTASKDSTDVLNTSVDKNVNALDKNTASLKSVLESNINLPTSFSYGFARKGSILESFDTGGYVAKGGLALLHTNEYVSKSYPKNYTTNTSINNAREIKEVHFHISGNDTTKIKKEVISALDQAFYIDRRRGISTSGDLL